MAIIALHVMPSVFTTLLTLFIVGRWIGRIEIKVDSMWEWFQRKMQDINGHRR